MTDPDQEILDFLDEGKQGRYWADGKTFNVIRPRIGSDAVKVRVKRRSGRHLYTEYQVAGNPKWYPGVQAVDEFMWEVGDGMLKEDVHG